MVPLYKGCHLKLSSTHLKLACSYGIADKLDKGKRACVFKIMESIYSEEFMASHSLTGRPAPGAPKEEAKPALPQEDVNAIIRKSTSSQYKFTYSDLILFLSLQNSSRRIGKSGTNSIVRTRRSGVQSMESWVSSTGRPRRRENV